MHTDHEYTRNFSLGALPGDTNAPPTQKGGKIIIIFFNDDEYDEVRSGDLGRPYYNQTEKYKKIIPGDRLSVPEGYVSDVERNEYPAEYAAFKRQSEIAEDGLPVEHWPLLTSGQVASLKYQNIMTVEQIAELSDTQLSNIGIGARSLRTQAQAYLEAAKTGAVPARLVTENEELRGQVGILTERMEAFVLRFEAMARKAGETVSDEADPVAKVRAEIAELKAPAVTIPENYKELGLKRLREICEVISSAPVTSKEGALEIIEVFRAAQ